MNQTTNKKALIPTPQEQEFYMGARRRGPLSDTILLHERFHLKKGFSAGIPQCDLLLEKDSGERVGVIPRIALRAVWDKAMFYTKNKAEEQTGISEEEWNEALKILTDFIKKQRPADAQTPVLIQDFLNLSELTYQSLFLHKASNVIALIHAAILGDIAETARLKKRWRRIRRYPHKVALEEENGGIFSPADAAILRSHGIETLNQIRKWDVYAIKNMLLEHSTSRLIEEINAAFKEDLARRRDKRYKRYPFLISYVVLAALAYIGYQYKYDLIKNEKVSLILLGIAALFTVDMLFIVYAAHRAIRRRKKKRPDYYYFTRWVRAAFSAMFLLAMFSLGSTTVFYGRYDGYSSVLYYRDLEDGTVSVAGLRDDTLHHIKIPQQLDGKTVSEIDIACFLGDEFSKVTIPAGVKIDKFAFAGCKNLKLVDASLSTSLGIGTFANCSSLQTVTLPLATHQQEIAPLTFTGCTSLTTVNGSDLYFGIGDMAFSDCHALQQLSLNHELKDVGHGAFQNCIRLGNLQFTESLTSIGAKAFYHCTSMTKVQLPTSLTTVGKQAFDGCLALKEVSVPFLGKDTAHTERGYRYVFDNCPTIQTLTLTATTVIGTTTFRGGEHIANIVLCEGLTEIADRAFKNYTYIASITFPSTVTRIGNNAFEGCSNIQTIDLASSSVTEIGSYAFKDCHLLSSLTLPTTLTVIPMGVAMNCMMLTSIIIHENVHTIEKDAFNRTGLASVQFHENITSIGENAFFDCDALTEITLPSSLTSLGRNAFAECGNLVTATVPFLGASKDNDKNGFSYLFADCPSLISLHVTNMETVTSTAFRGGEKLQYIALNEGVTAIEKKAFYHFSQMIGITLPTTLHTIGDSAFEGCNSLWSMDLSAQPLTSLGKNVFKDCAILTAITLPETLEAIPDGFAQKCPALTTVVLPAGLMKIGALAFSETNIYNPVFPLNLNSIGNKAFYNCQAITTLDLPYYLTYIGRDAFANCSSLTAASVPFLGKNPTNGFNGFLRLFRGCSALQALTITHMEKIGTTTLKGGEDIMVLNLCEGLTTVASRAFKNYTNLISIDFPTTLTTIGNNAFEGCVSLVAMDLAASSVTNIGNYAFKNCTALLLLTFPETLSVIPKGVAMNCISLQNITINQGIASIGKDAFNGSGLTGVEIHNNIHTVGTRAFYNCDYLTEIALPTSVVSIGKHAFGDCRMLSAATVPFLGKSATNDKGGFAHIFANCPAFVSVTVTAMTEMSKNTFKGGEWLLNVTLNEGLTTIGAHTFAGCSNLQSLTLPTTVTTIGDSAFENCYSFSTFDLTGCNLQSLGKNVFKNCHQISELKLPDTLTVIPEGLADGCTALGEINLPQGVTEIGKNAFAFTGLATLQLPETLVRLGERAFYCCTSLTDLVIPNSVSTIGEHAFGSCSGLACVKMPYLGESADNTQNGFAHVFEHAMYNLNKIEITAMTTIGESMLEGADYLHTLVLNEGVTTIKESALTNLRSLTTITLPSTLTTIESKAFEYCTGLTELDLSHTAISSIGESALYSCTSLERLMLPDTLTEIPKSMAEHCYSLRVVRLPANLTVIGEKAFFSCMNLMTLNSDPEMLSFDGVAMMPATLTVIGERAFAECHWLEFFNAGESLNTIGASAFEECLFLQEIILPETLRTVEKYAFRYCNALESLTIPQGVETIGYRIANGCSTLTMLEVPFIGYNAKYAFTLRYITNSSALSVVKVTAAEKLAARTFANCSNLEFLQLNDGIVSIGKNVTTNCTNLNTVYLPSSLSGFESSFPYGTVVYID